MITPGQALWILNNLPQKPPSSSIMPSVWQNSRRQVVEELQAIVDAEQSVHLTCATCGSTNSFEYDKELCGQVCVRCGTRR